MTDTQIRSRALKALDRSMSSKLGIPVRDLAERRDRLEKMWNMLQNIGTGIIGEGFAIIRHADQGCDEYFEVYRLGFGTERVKNLGRVAAMFTPEMFHEGIQSGPDLCPVLPGTQRCNSL